MAQLSGLERAASVSPAGGDDELAPCAQGNIATHRTIPIQQRRRTARAIGTSSQCAGQTANGIRSSATAGATAPAFDLCRAIDDNAKKLPLLQNLAYKDPLPHGL